MTTAITDNTAQSRFELAQDGHTAFANYRITGDTLLIDYVEAPPALRGTGAAGKLMEGITAHARQHHLKLHPICGYAASWLHKHKEHADLMA